MNRKSLMRVAVALASCSLPPVLPADPVGLVSQLKTPFVAPMTNDGYTAFVVTNDAVTLGYVRTYLNVAEQQGASVSFDVGTGKSLTIEKLIGGRGRTATLTKTGGGTLALKDAATYGGTIKLAGGTLALTGRRVPSADELPANPYLHVDASDLSNLETNLVGDTTYVTYWKNSGVGVSGTESVAGLRPFAYDAHPTYFRPWLLKDALGPGLNTIDFGLWNPSYPYNSGNATTYGENWPVKCGMMTFAKSKTENVTTLPKNFRTVIALVGAQRGGGLVVGTSSATQAYEDPFDRGGNWEGAKSWTTGICGTYKKNGVSYPAFVLQDGRQVDGNTQYDSPAYHVIAMRQDPTDFSFKLIGGREHVSATGPIGGGCILGEVFIYDRDLTDEETRDVSAYLMYKWFGMTAGGYAKPDGQANLQKVSIAAASTISIPAGQTNRIDALDVEAPLTVKGGGTLEVFDATLNGDLIYAEGSEIRYADRPDTDLLAALPPGISMRLDAKTPTSFTMNWDTSSGTNMLSSGTNKIVRAASCGGGNAMAIHNSGGVSYATDYWSGQPVMDFGWKTSYGMMFYTVPMDGVRSVFFVHRGDGAAMGAQTEGHAYDGGFTVGGLGYSPFLLGVNNNGWDFFRDSMLKGATSGNVAFYGNNGGDCLQSGYGSAYLNGTKWTKGPSGDFEEVEIYGEKCAAHISAVKCCCGRSQYAGSGQIGELIVYERLLTARERVQLRNYLMKRWFGKTEAELTPLPEKPASKAGYVPPAIIVVASETATLGETTISNLTLRGSGKIVKAGAATVVQTMDLNSFTGTVEVASGTLTVNGYMMQRMGKEHATNILARFTVDQGLVTKKSGTVTRVNEWHSTVGDLYLKCASDTDSIRLEHDDAIRSDYVMMEGYGMYFYTNSVATSVTNIRAVAWALGSQTGGGALMGGDKVTGDGGGIGWHRGDSGKSGTPGYSYLDPLVQTAHCQTGLLAKNAMWRVNAQPADPGTTHLTGGWDAIGVSETNLSAAALNASAVALEPRSGGIRQGHQRLLELVLYSEPLTEEEFVDNEAYLMNKWKLFNAVGTATNVVDLVLKPGTTLLAGGQNQYFKSLEGAGATVTDGGVKPATYVYDFENPGTLAVDGAFEFRPGFMVELRNAPGYFEPVTIVTATTLEELDNYSKTCVTGSAGNPVLVWRWDGANARYNLIVRFEGLNVTGDVSFANETAVTTTVSGAGTVTKTGAGELILHGLGDFRGTLHVAQGALTVDGKPVAVTPNLPLEGRTMHFDATVGVDVKYTADGLFVNRWDSRVGDAYVSAWYVNYPLLMDELNGHPVVRLNQGLRFLDSSGANLYLEDVRSVLWVIGSQEGGGFILGGGHHNKNLTYAEAKEQGIAGYAWHRGGTPSDISSPILCNSSAAEVTDGTMWTNGVRLTNVKATPFSGGYDQISWRAQTDDKWASASALASDTRNVAGSQGHQRLGEIVIYNRRLSDDELAAAEAYLNVKWGLNGAILPDSGEVDLIVDAGATADLGGTNRAVRSVGGAGTLAGDVRSPVVTYAGDALSVGGTFYFGEGFKVVVTALPESAKTPDGWRILSASSFGNRANLKRQAVEGVPTGSLKLVLRPDGLYLRDSSGIAIVVR